MEPSYPGSRAARVETRPRGSRRAVPSALLHRVSPTSVGWRARARRAPQPPGRTRPPRAAAAESIVGARQMRTAARASTNIQPVTPAESPGSAYITRLTTTPQIAGPTTSPAPAQRGRRSLAARRGRPRSRRRRARPAPRAGRAAQGLLTDQMSSTRPPGRCARNRAMLSQAVSLESVRASVSASRAVWERAKPRNLWSRLAARLFMDLIRDLAGLGDCDLEHRNNGGVPPVVRLIFVAQTHSQHVAARAQRPFG